MSPLLGPAVPSLVAAFDAGITSGAVALWLPGCFVGATSLLQTFGPHVSCGTAADTTQTAALLTELLVRTAGRVAPAVGAGAGGPALAVAYLQLVHTAYMCAPRLLLSGSGGLAEGVLGHALGVAAGCVGGEQTSAAGAAAAAQGKFCPCPSGVERHRETQRLALALLGAVARATRVERRRPAAPRGAAAAAAAAPAAVPADYERKESHAAALLEGLRRYAAQQLASSTTDATAVAAATAPGGFLLLRAVLRGLADTLASETAPRTADVLAPLLHLMAPACGIHENW